MKRGFSLIEILIAAALLSGLLTATYFSFLSVRRGLASGRQRYDFTLQSTIVARRLELLMAEASPYKERAKDRHFEGSKHRLAFTTLRGQTQWGPPRYIVLEMQGKKAIFSSDYLGWLVDEPTEASQTKTVLENVRQMEFSYNDGKTDEWREEWDMSRKGRLPALVKLVLRLETDSGMHSTLPLILRTRLDRDPSIP